MDFDVLHFGNLRNTVTTTMKSKARSIQNIFILQLSILIIQCLNTVQYVQCIYHLPIDVRRKQPEDLNIFTGTYVLNNSEKHLKLPTPDFALKISALPLFFNHYIKCTLTSITRGLNEYIFFLQIRNRISSDLLYLPQLPIVRCTALCCRRPSICMACQT